MRRTRLILGTTSALVIATGLLAAGGTAVADPGRSAPSPTSSASPWWPPQPPTTLAIDTGGTEIGREDYVEGTVTLDGFTHATEVRGRGNSTWGWPKKPYKLKLTEDAALLGTREYDEWVLLASYADRSALRTAAAFTLARQTRLLWTPRFRFVDVVINGTSQGLYMLTEQVEEGKGRVKLPEDGHLLEINKRYLRDDEPGFRTGRGTAVAFKDPDEVTKAQRRRVRGAVTRFERVLYGKGFADPKTGYAAHIDTKKLIDWYLVEELFGNQDSNFQSSVHFTWSPGKRFEFGPVWDFDISAGTRWRAQSEPDVWHTRVGDHWIARMLEDPKFSARVKRRWAGLRPTVDRLIAQIPGAAAPLAASAAADWQQWHTSGDLPWTVHGATYDAEVDYLAWWLRRRAAWLSNNEARLGLTRVRTQERDRTVYVPVELQEAPTSPMTIDFATVSGTASAGADFADASGRLTFASGQRVRYIPVRILPDTTAEGRETFEVRLQSSSGAVVGSPRAATVTIRPSDLAVDAAIREAGGNTLLGVGVVDAAGAGQRLRARVSPGRERSYDVRVTNAATQAVTARLTGGARGPVQLRYLVRGEDVTRRLTGAGRGFRIRAGRTLRVRLEVAVDRRARRGATGRAHLRAAWRGDSTVVDLVGVDVRVR